mmetsp:Transcript_32662/g.105506  ORF Transcript_32662/g.105506 Transcript_32662/m.105506 type:complete len:117 (+) Transcript_32662:1107-1457(+)|eukprot:scaffold2980_cov132-Isochrysis_galbana.AAC.2
MFNHVRHGGSWTDSHCGRAGARHGAAVACLALIEKSSDEEALSTLHAHSVRLCAQASVECVPTSGPCRGWPADASTALVFHGMQPRFPDALRGYQREALRPASICAWPPWHGPPIS